MTNDKIILIKRITKYKTVEGTKPQFFLTLYSEMAFTAFCHRSLQKDTNYGPCLFLITGLV